MSCLCLTGSFNGCPGELGEAAEQGRVPQSRPVQEGGAWLLDLSAHPLLALGA